MLYAVGSIAEKVVVVVVDADVVAVPEDAGSGCSALCCPLVTRDDLREVVAATAATQADAGLEEDAAVAVAAAAAVVAAVAIVYLDEAGIEGCGMGPEAKSEAPRR